MKYKPLYEQLPDKFFSNLMSRHQEKNKMDWKLLDAVKFKNYMDSIYIELFRSLGGIFCDYHKSDWGIFFCGEMVQLGDSNFTLELSDVQKFSESDQLPAESWKLYHSWRGFKSPLCSFRREVAIDVVLDGVFWDPLPVKKISAGVIESFKKSFWRCPKTQSLIHGPIKKAIPIAPIFEYIDKDFCKYDVWAIMIDDVKEFCKVPKNIDFDF